MIIYDVYLAVYLDICILTITHKFWIRCNLISRRTLEYHISDSSYDALNDDIKKCFRLLSGGLPADDQFLLSKSTSECFGISTAEKRNGFMISNWLELHEVIRMPWFCLICILLFFCSSYDLVT